MITIDRPDLTVAQLGDDFWLAVEGVPCCGGAHNWTDASHPESIVPPADVLALLEPCETCDGIGVRYVDSYGAVWGNTLAKALNLTDTVPCTHCINGRPKFQIVVPCPLPHVLAGESTFHADGGEENGLTETGCIGTVSRTFTVTGDKPLLEVVRPGQIPTDPNNLVYCDFDPSGAYAIVRDGAVVDTPMPVGHTEATTHALHVRVVES